jgi:hypothetical protein
MLELVIWHQFMEMEEALMEKNEKLIDKPQVR